MNFFKKQHEGDENKYSIFSYSASHYSIATYDAFCDTLIFHTDIKSQWTADQLISLGNYCNEIYNAHEKKEF